MPLKFKKPPINELVIGTYFNPPLFEFRAEHVGLFWARIRKEYPKITQQLPVGAIIDAPGDIFPLPRFWIVSQNDSMLMQIQKNAFLFNWRKREEEYPHYDSVKSEFDRFYLEFSDFIRDEVKIPIVSIEVLELTYVNLITECEYWKAPADTRNVFPSFQFVEMGIDDSAPTDFTHTVIYQIDDQLSIQMKIQIVHPAKQPTHSNLRFEFRATGRLGGAAKSDADKWFDRAHEAIGHCFRVATNPDVQNKYWQPMEQT